MNRKLKVLALMALATTLTAGCSLQGNAQSGKNIVIEEDVQLESALSDSSLEVQRLNDIVIEDDIPNTGFYQGDGGENIFYKENGELNHYKISTKEKRKIVEGDNIIVSKNGEKAMTLSSKGKEAVVHNLINGKIDKIDIESPWDTFFIDEEGNEIASFDINENKLQIIKVDSKETREWNISEFDTYSLTSTIKVEDDYYISARSKADGLYGVFKLSENHAVEKVFSAQDKEDQISTFHILKNNNIIFEAMSKEQSGIYLFNQENNEVQQLIAGGKDSEGIWIPTYILSPDESKIMFDTPVKFEGKYKTNVYMGEIIDGKLANTVRILENANLYAVISISGHWSEDSKTAYIVTPRENSEYVGALAVFQVK
ncbi:hypothetical protein H9649_11905 [Sporosarcina sp. Sa2YVA2]|uniref:Lipoprotein n=1 Tax=Sporosarcina quadrami TaxID=2762234 RepID=A0ABR8UC27_9BACL|nr:hypothetical protein [Sporosarcina quadrami]MBD7985294.1 hypothetical protein [Sporosarcina quadrami]